MNLSDNAGQYFWNLMYSVVAFIDNGFSNICSYIYKRRKPILIKLAFAYILYINMLANNLVNHMDGIWHGFYSNDSGWCISIGRWARKFIYSLHFNDHSVPMNYFVTFIFIIAGIEIIIYLFNLQEKRLADYTVSFLLMSNTIVSVWLSHAYMSIDFSACFFLSVLSALLIVISLRERGTIFILGGH